MPSPGSSTACSPRRATASAGRGTGSTWSATPTSSTRSGAIATGSSGPSTRTCPTTGSSSTRSPAISCPRRAGRVNADGIVATTMLAIGPWGGIDRQKRLADIVDDQVDTIGRSFLGLTIACAAATTTSSTRSRRPTTTGWRASSSAVASCRIKSYLSHKRAPAEGPARSRGRRSRSTVGGRPGSRRRRTGSRRPSTGIMRRSRGACCPGSRTTCWRRGITRTGPAGQAGVSVEEFARRAGLAGIRPAGAGSITWPAPRRRVPPAGSAGPRLRRRAGRRGLDGRRRAAVVGRTTARTGTSPSRPSCSRRVRCRSTRASRGARSAGRARSRARSGSRAGSPTPTRTTAPGSPGRSIA